MVESALCVKWWKSLIYTQQEKVRQGFICHKRTESKTPLTHPDLKFHSWKHSIHMHTLDPTYIKGKSSVWRSLVGKNGFGWEGYLEHTTKLDRCRLWEKVEKTQLRFPHVTSSHFPAIPYAHIYTLPNTEQIPHSLLLSVKVVAQHSPSVYSCNDIKRKTKS